MVTDATPATRRGDAVMDALETEVLRELDGAYPADPMSLPSDPAPEVDPNVFLFATTFGSKAQLAALLKVDTDVVTQMEAERRVFSFVGDAKPYPVFGLYQALPEVAGEPLAAVLERFHEAMDAGTCRMDTSDIAAFFRVPTRMLAWATPLEVLLGHRLYDAPLEREAAWLFNQPGPIRLAAVLGAAKDELQHRRAW